MILQLDDLSGMILLEHSVILCVHFVCSMSENNVLTFNGGVLV